MDIVILTTTRGEETSFLSEAPRVNVALSRARLHLIVVGQESLFQSSALWKAVNTKSASCFRPQVILRLLGGGN